MPPALRTLPMHVMMVMMMHVIMMTATRIIGRRCMWTLLGLFHPPFLLLRTSDYLLLLLLLLLHLCRLLHRVPFSVVSMRASSWRWLAARPVAMARRRTDLDVLRIYRLHRML